MQIAVDARGMFPLENDETNWVQELILGMAIQRPDHQFLLLSDSVVNSSIPLPRNTAVIRIGPVVTNALLLKFWYDVKIPFALKKHKADIFVCTNGLASLTTSVPQLLLVENISFLKKQKNAAGKFSFFYKKYTPSFLKKVKKIATVSAYLREELQKSFGTAGDKITVIKPGTNPLFKAVDWQDKEQVKDKIADGFEYFSFTGGLRAGSNFFNLLKAFSIFKKWQKTGMKLIISGATDENYNKELEKLSTYKYRNDVILKPNITPTETAEIVSSSYAYIEVDVQEKFGVNMVNAMQAEVPVILSATKTHEEIALDAALYADASKPEEIAEQLKRMFKDEQLRSQLIERGKKLAAYYNADFAVATAWQLVESTVST